LISRSPGYKTHCRGFLNQFANEDKKVLLEHLKEFVEHPFVRIKLVTSELLGRALYSGNVYVYWVNSEELA